MVVLFILFVIQFSIACACLAVDDDAQKKIVEIGWNTTTKIANQTIIDFETAFQCCGFDSEETKVLVDGVCPGVRIDMLQRYFYGSIELEPLN